MRMIPAMKAGPVQMGGSTKLGKKMRTAPIAAKTQKMKEEMHPFFCPFMTKPGFVWGAFGVKELPARRVSMT